MTNTIKFKHRGLSCLMLHMRDFDFPEDEYAVHIKVGYINATKASKANIIKSAKQLLDDLLKARSASERTNLRTTSRPT